VARQKKRWPWLKDYHGENAVGYYNWSNYSQYLWLDQNLKKEILL